jgi:hypothetical protein
MSCISVLVVDAVAAVPVAAVAVVLKLYLHVKTKHC